LKQIGAEKIDVFVVDPLRLAVNLSGDQISGWHFPGTGIAGKLTDVFEQTGRVISSLTSRNMLANMFQMS